jgi:hypothetical protein
VDPALVIIYSKINFNDGFWRMVMEAGQQFNFAYVLLGEAPGRLAVNAAWSIWLTTSEPLSLNDNCPGSISTMMVMADERLPVMIVLNSLIVMKACDACPLKPIDDDPCKSNHGRCSTLT